MCKAQPPLDVRFVVDLLLICCQFAVQSRSVFVPVEKTVFCAFLQHNDRRRVCYSSSMDLHTFCCRSYGNNMLLQAHFKHPVGCETQQA